VAGAEPKLDLDQIKIISYSISVDGEWKEKCHIAQQAWDTAFEFVANQSTKLKIITFRELMNGADKFGTKFAAMPQLHLTMLVVETITACVGVLDTRLTALAQATCIVATDRLIHLPFVEIWTDKRWIRSSHGNFEQFAINRSESVLKEFVNDWTKSQSQQ